MKIDFIPRWALFYPLVKPEISVCIPHFLYIRGKQFPFYTTLFPASLIYNRETISILYYFVSRISYIYSIMWNKTTYILNLCIIRDTKESFRKDYFSSRVLDFFDILFVPRYARDKKNVKKISNPLEKVIFPEILLCFPL